MWKLSILLIVAGLTMVEVWLLLTVGALLGTGWTFMWILATFLLGLFLLRVQGVQSLLKIHRRLIAETIPGRELLELVLIAVGSGLLILPGFFTDFLGLVLFLPPVRWILRGMTVRILMRSFPGSPRPMGRAPSTEDAIEITAEEIPP